MAYDEEGLERLGGPALAKLVGEFDAVLERHADWHDRNPDPESWSDEETSLMALELRAATGALHAYALMCSSSKVMLLGREEE